MSKFSRKCYHGVPRIIQNSFKGEEIKEIGELPKEWKNRPEEVRKYFETHRININVRQVYPK